jgi:hypothetical protein
MLPSKMTVLSGKFGVFLGKIGVIGLIGANYLFKGGVFG